MRAASGRASRRRFLAGGGAAGAALALGGVGRPARAAMPATKQAKARPGSPEEVETSATEDLMREHGLLDRLLLLYEAGGARLERGARSAQADAQLVLGRTANIVASFIQDYHEKLEEQFLFPRFEAAGKMTDLVATLRRQHEKGRALTDEIRRATGASGGAGVDGGVAGAGGASTARLAGALQAFVRMYRPHAAREDTVLFPAFKELVRGKAYDELGEEFEVKEHALFGEHGFESMVAEVEKLEKSFGIYDLTQFTPR
jgi:hemerythrin-like domain-containing protein